MHCIISIFIQIFGGKQFIKKNKKKKTLFHLTESYHWNSGNSVWFSFILCKNVICVHQIGKSTTMKSWHETTNNSFLGTIIFETKKTLIFIANCKWSRTVHASSCCVGAPCDTSHLKKQMYLKRPTGTLTYICSCVSWDNHDVVFIIISFSFHNRTAVVWQP